jgi:hypothetical protein
MLCFFKKISVIDVGGPGEAVTQLRLRHYHYRILLIVNSCIKVRLHLQADKSPVVVKGPFFPRVVNPRSRIHGTNV